MSSIFKNASYFEKLEDSSDHKYSEQKMLRRDIENSLMRPKRNQDKVIFEKERAV